MAAHAIAADRTVSVEQYLSSSYEHDMEYIDGELKEKPIPSRLHGYIQMLIGQWFLNHKAQWHVAAESEARTQVRQNAFRLPDVSITRLGTLSGRVQRHPPLIAIEILSEDDRFVDLERRASDLETMGTDYIWLIDPENRRAWVWLGTQGWRPVQELCGPRTASTWIFSGCGPRLRNIRQRII